VPPKVSVVVPTISGREVSLARTLASYEETLRDVDHEIIIIKDQPTWPAACNRGYEKSSGDVIHWTADDLEAMEGWHVRVLKFLAAKDELPAPRVYNFLPPPEGEWANSEDGGDRAIPEFTRIPIMRRDQAERIGLWPEDLIYYADLWVTDKGRALGIETRMCHGYDFVHHWSGIGRVDSRENMDVSGERLRLLREEM
jgi:glycosyltransferase involved in cell wall biosynthesis